MGLSLPKGAEFPEVLPTATDYSGGERTWTFPRAHALAVMEDIRRLTKSGRDELFRRLLAEATEDMRKAVQAWAKSMEVGDDSG